METLKHYTELSCLSQIWSLDPRTRSACSVDVTGFHWRLAIKTKKLTVHLPARLKSDIDKPTCLRGLTQILANALVSVSCLYGVMTGAGGRVCLTVCPWPAPIYRAPTGRWWLPWSWRRSRPPCPPAPRPWSTRQTQPPASGLAQTSSSPAPPWCACSSPWNTHTQCYHVIVRSEYK